MSIIEAILELERQRDIAEEMGFDPCRVSVMIPVGGRSKMEWEEMEDSEIVASERGTMIDLFLKN
jgi:hypothetical protein